MWSRIISFPTQRRCFDSGVLSRRTVYGAGNGCGLVLYHSSLKEDNKIDTTKCNNAINPRQSPLSQPHAHFLKLQHLEACCWNVTTHCELTSDMLSTTSQNKTNNTTEQKVLILENSFLTLKPTFLSPSDPISKFSLPDHLRIISFSVLYVMKTLLFGVVARVPAWWERGVGSWYVFLVILSSRGL